MKSTLLSSAHGLHTWVLDIAVLPQPDKEKPKPPPGGPNMPEPQKFSPPGTLTDGIARVTGLVMWGILAFSFLVALVCTGMIWKAHKDGGQASFVGLGMAMLTVIISGSLVTIFNWVT